MKKKKIISVAVTATMLLAGCARAEPVYVTDQQPEVTYQAVLAESDILLIAAAQATQPEETMPDMDNVLAGCANRLPEVPELESAEIEALQKIAIAEACIDGVTAEALVIRVVLNRVLSDQFPNDVISVIEEDGQFQAVTDGVYDQMVPDETSARAWHMVETGWDMSKGATYFASTSLDENAWHNRTLDRLFSYGHTNYYKEREEEE